MDTPAPPAPPEQAGWVRRLSAACLRHPRLVATSLGGAILGMVVTALVPLVQRLIIDDVIVARTRPLLPWALLLVAMALVVFASTYVRRSRGGRLALSVQHDLRTRVFASLSSLDGARQDDLDTGQLVGRTTSDLTMIQGLLFILPNLIGSVLQFAVALVAMAVLSLPLTLVAVVTVPVLFLVARSSRTRLHPAAWVAQQRAGEVAGVVESAIAGVRVVKGFGQEDAEVGRLSAISRRLYADRLRSIRLVARFAPALASVPAMAQVGILAFGGWLALTGSITLGTFLAFSTYLAQMTGPVRIVAALVTVGQQARTSVERVFEVIDARPVVTETTDPARLDLAALRDGRAAAAGTPALALTGVRFGYVPSSPVLTGLDLLVAPGEVVALVGPSGSGKSTIAQLLPRFYDPQAGTVALAGTDVRDLRLADVRGALGIVPEETFLFSDTLAANIAYGLPGATRAQVEAAARAAQAEAFITALPDGYDTVVGERGLTLSGGQRQRIALARALVTDPAILLLDDATSAVDARVEAAIHDALRSAMRGRTTLLIAHRRSTLSLADRIAVLDAGRVVATGTHEELLATSGLYRRLIAGEDLDAVETAETVDAAGTADGTDGSGGRAPAAAASDARAPDGTTPGLWDARRAAAVRARSARGDAAPAPAGGPGGGAGGPGGGGMHGGFLAGPATPELLALVRALPPATDDPDIPDDVARAPAPHFRLTAALRPVRAGLAAGLAFMVVDAALSLALPLLVRLGVDDGVQHHRGRVVAAAAVIALAVVLLDWAVQGAGARLVGRAGERVLYLLRVKLFAHLQRLSLAYYERELTGRILTRLTTDVDSLSQFLQTGLTTALTGVLTVVGIAVALVVLDPHLALIVAAVVPPLVVATILFRRASSRAYSEARERISVVNADLAENVSGMRVAQAFRREGRNEGAFAARSDAYRASRTRAQRYVAVYFAFVQLLADLAAVLVLAEGAHRVAAATLSVGALLAYLLYLDLFFSPIQQLAQVFDNAQQAQVALSRMGALLRTPTSTPLPEHPVPVPAPLRGEIVVEGVQFRYGLQDVPPDAALASVPSQGAPAAALALAGVDLRIAPGETVAFVGQTGAGKSTLVKLVTRMYDPTAGRVLVDGVDLRDIDLSAYRHHLGVVPQEAWLSPGTVAEAIAYGRPGASPARIEAAARAVGAHDMIATLAAGYLHPVGERGRELSAGQRQLIALARAELVEPAILVLDEATAALDLATEGAVEAASQALAARRTTLVVAHRLATAARADRIVVLEAGRIVEQGPHAELVAAGGPYAALWDASTGHGRLDVAAATT